MNTQITAQQFKSNFAFTDTWRDDLSKAWWSLTHRQQLAVEYQTGSDRRLIKGWIAGKPYSSFKFKCVIDAIHLVLEEAEK